MVQKIREFIDKRDFNTIVLSGLLISFIVWVAAQTYGIVSTVHATENAQAAICKDVQQNKFDIEENKRLDDERQKQNEQNISQINERLATIEANSEASKDLLDKIWDELKDR